MDILIQACIDKQSPSSSPLSSLVVVIYGTERVSSVSRGKQYLLDTRDSRTFASLRMEIVGVATTTLRTSLIPLLRGNLLGELRGIDTIRENIRRVMGGMETKRDFCFEFGGKIILFVRFFFSKRSESSFRGEKEKNGNRFL